jgi:hypothetical protein
LAGFAFYGCSNACFLSTGDQVTTCATSGGATIVDRSTGVSAKASLDVAEELGGNGPSCTDLSVSFSSALANCSIDATIQNDCQLSATIVLAARDVRCDTPTGTTFVSGVVEFLPDATPAFRATFSLTLETADGHELDVSNGTANQNDCHPTEVCDDRY